MLHRGWRRFGLSILLSQTLQTVTTVTVLPATEVEVEARLVGQCLHGVWLRIRRQAGLEHVVAQGQLLYLLAKGAWRGRVKHHSRSAAPRRLPMLPWSSGKG